MFYICDKETGEILSVGDEFETLEKAQEELESFYDESCEIKEYNFALKHCSIERWKIDGNHKGKLYIPTCGDSLEDTEPKIMKYFKTLEEVREYLNKMDENEILPDVSVTDGAIGPLVYVMEYFVEYLGEGADAFLFEWSFDEFDYRIKEIVKNEIFFKG